MEFYLKIAKINVRMQTINIVHVDETIEWYELSSHYFQKFGKMSNKKPALFCI